MVQQPDLPTEWLLVAAALASTACDESVDTSYRTNLITVDEIQMQRVVPNEPLPFFVDAVLRNRTTHPVSTFSRAMFIAGDTSADFNLTFNREPSTLVGCLEPDPWDVPPGTTKTVRMRVDLRSNTAGLDVACTFDPQMLGFEYEDSRAYTAPRVGPAIPDDFVGPVHMELRGGLDAECTPEDCPWWVLVKGSGEIEVPP